MYDINKTIVTGHVAMEPKLTYFGDKTAKLFFTLANTINTGAATPVTYFIPITIYGKLAERVDGDIEKGMLVMIEGRLEYTTKKNENGGYTSYTSIRASNVLYNNTGNSTSGSGYNEDESVEQPETIQKLSKEVKGIFGDDELEDLSESLF
jgi:single stranded DNA-binding protein